MTGLASRNFSESEDVRPFDKGRMEVITLGRATVGRATFSPGWKWSECVKPVAGTDRCEVAHLGYVVAGRMHVVMQDGTEGVAGPGDLVEIAPGHDAWIVGDEPCVFLDVQGAADYAKQTG
jgi:ethanolamine utilization protein EutQ (cupin superfamily)